MNCLIKVGRDQFFDKKKNKQRTFNYSDVPYDEDGWADASKYIPADYDLLYLKTENKTYDGWWSGNQWDGLRIKPKNKVLFWKQHV